VTGDTTIQQPVIAPVPLAVCPVVLGPPSAGDALVLLIKSPLAGGLGLLSQSLLPSGLPGSVDLRAGLDEVIQHVRDLAEQAKSLPTPAPAGSDTPSLPTPAPAPPAPPAPQEQSNGSSVSGSSHSHHKGGHAYAIVAGALLVLCLRPLALSRLTRSSGYSRSFRPLALPG
jgi:hypothetical protein